jgi:hypothetical protein
LNEITSLPNTVKKKQQAVQKLLVRDTDRHTDRQTDRQTDMHTQTRC